MAKGTMEDADAMRKREPRRILSRAQQPDDSYPGASSLSMPPNSNKPCQQAQQADADSAPLKNRIALGYVKVKGRQAPIYAPIPGFEHLFTAEQVAAPWSFPPAAAPARSPSSTDAPAPRRGVKRGRVPSAPEEDDDDNDADEEAEPVAKSVQTESLNVGDVEALKAFYAVRFRELTMKPLREVVTAWVKRLAPNRQRQYGPYMRYSPKDSAAEIKNTGPPWWPADVPYIEPSHLKLRHLVPLAVDIMLVHRRIDEECGKRKHASWIDKLEKGAEYCVSSKDTEAFSSSKGGEYNQAMKTRALELILPSLFDVARSHEDYVAQWDLYEGSGNKDSGHGKYVSWQPAPRPYRSIKRKLPQRWKRSRMSVKLESASEDDCGDETEADEPMDCTGNSFSSYQSTMSYTEDIKMFPQTESDSAPAGFPPAEAPAPSQPAAPVPVPAAIPTQAATEFHAQSGMPTGFTNFDQSPRRLYLDDVPAADTARYAPEHYLRTNGSTYGVTGIPSLNNSIRPLAELNPYAFIPSTSSPFSFITPQYAMNGLSHTDFSSAYLGQPNRTSFPLANNASAYNTGPHHLGHGSFTSAPSDDTAHIPHGLPNWGGSF